MIDVGDDGVDSVCVGYGQQFSKEYHGMGAGRTSYLHRPTLWLQERVDSGEIRKEKGKGEHKTADIGTKAVSAEVLRKHFKRR